MGILGSRALDINVNEQEFCMILGYLATPGRVGFIEAQIPEGMTRSSEMGAGRTQEREKRKKATVSRQPGFSCKALRGKQTVENTLRSRSDAAEKGGCG